VTGEATAPTVDHPFGAELLRLRPRSGYEYAFSGDAPRYVHCLLFILLGAFALLSIYLANCLSLITADLWFDWVAYLKVLGFMLLCMLGGFALSAGVLSWAFHPWLRRHELVVYEHGFRGRFPDLEFTVPLEELIEVWICRHPECHDDDTCIARNDTRARPDESATAIRIVESIVTWYFTALAWIFALLLALAGGTDPAPPKRQQVVKAFLVVKGGAVYSLGRYLRRFHLADRSRLMEMLESCVPQLIHSHGPLE
jgi:hypothetical protein